MALVHKLAARASMDLDFSMPNDFPEGKDVLHARVSTALHKTFRESGYEIIDLKMLDQPNNAPVKEYDSLAGFWGGYKVEFKLVAASVYKEYQGNLEQLRKRAVHIGNSPKFEIDISRFEYTADKEEDIIDGYRIYVYSPLMIVCEKLRAICQQTKEYGPIILRSGRPGAPRARDFFDIFTLVEHFKLEITNEKSIHILQEMFSIKRVPIDFLNLIESQREFHKTGAQSLYETVALDAGVKEFDFYFDYVINMIQPIQEAINKTPPVYKDASL